MKVCKSNKPTNDIRESRRQISFYSLHTAGTWVNTYFIKKSCFRFTFGVYGNAFFTFLWRHKNINVLKLWFHRIFLIDMEITLMLRYLTFSDVQHTKTQRQSEKNLCRHFVTKRNGLYRECKKLRKPKCHVDTVTDCKTNQISLIPTWEFTDVLAVCFSPGTGRQSK